MSELDEQIDAIWWANYNLGDNRKRIKALIAKEADRQTSKMLEIQRKLEAAERKETIDQQVKKAYDKGYADACTKHNWWGDK